MEIDKPDNSQIKSTKRKDPRLVIEERRQLEEIRQKEAAEKKLAELKAFRNELREAIRVAYLAYSDPAVAKEYLTDHGFDRESVLILGSWVGTEGICCLRDGRAYVAFRGTSSPISDVLIDLLFIPWYRPAVHFGFGKSWKSVSDEVNRWLQHHKDQYESITLAGHSLGGAIAQVAALDLVKKCPIENVITIGAPRSCFWTTGHVYNIASLVDAEDKRLGDVTYRVVNKLDVISKIPPPLLLFEHVGEMVYLSQSGEMFRGEEAKAARSDDILFRAFWDSIRWFLMEPQVATFGVVLPPDATISASPDAPHDEAQQVFASARKPKIPWESVRSKCIGIVDFHKRNRQLLPLNFLDVVIFLLFICISPILTLVFVTVYFSVSTASHLRADYCRYFFPPDDDMEAELAEIRHRLNKGPSRARVIAGKILQRIVAFLALASFCTILVLIVKHWVIPTFRTFFL